MSDWRSITDDREKYKAYLCSREWALLRNEVRKRCGGICERCNDNEMECVHHLTYARKYRERLEDLAGWCNACHEFTHGKTDHDPAAYSPQTLLTTGEHLRRQGFTWLDICGFAFFGAQIVGHMGKDWFIKASRGEFRRRQVGDEELEQLVQERRKAQGINT
jgi:hypothetical protein